MPTPEEQAKFNALVEKLNKEPLPPVQAQAKPAPSRSSVEDYFKGSYGPVTERLDARTEAAVKANCDVERIKENMAGEVSLTSENVSRSVNACVAKVKDQSGQTR